MSSIWILVVIGWVVISAVSQAKKMQRPGNGPPAPPPVARPPFPYQRWEAPPAPPSAPIPAPAPAPAAPAPVRRLTESVENETVLIAGEAQTLGSDAEQLTSAGDINRSVRAFEAEAGDLGRLSGLSSDITALAAPTRTPDRDQPDPEVPMVDEVGVGPMLTGLDNPQTLARAIVYAEIFGRPVAQRRHRRSMEPLVRR